MLPTSNMQASPTDSMLEQLVLLETANKIKKDTNLMVAIAVIAEDRLNSKQLILLSKKLKLAARRK